MEWHREMTWRGEQHGGESAAEVSAINLNDRSACHVIAFGIHCNCLLMIHFLQRPAHALFTFTSIQWRHDKDPRFEGQTGICGFKLGESLRTL